MRLFLIMILFVCGSVFSEVTHSGLTGTNIHTVYRWQFADSTARANQTVAAADTMKLAYQRSDSSTWVLIATTGTKWRKISIGGPILGTTGTFSGALTGTTLNTGNGANELYPMNQPVLTSSNATFNTVTAGIGSFPVSVITDSVKAVTGTFSGALTGTTLNTGNGANELYPMNQAVTTTSNVTFNTVTAGIGSFPVSVITDSVKAVTGTFSGALTGTTLNTGNGANELYPMNQAVTTTSNVQFAKGRFDSITTNGTNYFKYIEGTFPCTLKTSDVTVQQIRTAYWTKTGNVLTISFPSVTGTSNSTSLKLFCTIPYLPKQTYSGYNSDITVINTLNNGSSFTVQASISTAFPYISLGGSVYTSSGIKGTLPFTLSYITE